MAGVADLGPCACGLSSGYPLDSLVLSHIASSESAKSSVNLSSAELAPGLVWLETLGLASPHSLSGWLGFLTAW